MKAVNMPGRIALSEEDWVDYFRTSSLQFRVESLPVMSRGEVADRVWVAGVGGNGLNIRKWTVSSSLGRQRPSGGTLTRFQCYHSFAFLPRSCFFNSTLYLF